MKSVALHNLGCKVNSYETEVMQQKLVEKGYRIVPFDTKADIYIVNTCTVTNIADRKSRQMLHRAKQLNPEAVVVAVGCYVQTGQESLMKDNSVDLCIGNNRKRDIAEILRTPVNMKRRSLPGRRNIRGCTLKFRTAATSSAHTVPSLMPEGGCGAAGLAIFLQRYRP